MDSSPDDPTVAFSLTVKNSAKALDFYTRAFGAEELMRVPALGGGIVHAEFMIGNTKIFMSDEAEDHHAFAMPEGGMSSCLFGITTENCDTAYARAVEAGATSLSEPENAWWGSRYAIILDPFGYRWGLSLPIPPASPEEMEKHLADL